jgi:hypothetical protein
VVLPALRWLPSQVARAHNDQIEALLHPSDDAQGLKAVASRPGPGDGTHRKNGKQLYPPSVPLIDHIRLREELMTARMQYAGERVETAKLDKVGYRLLLCRASVTMMFAAIAVTPVDDHGIKQTKASVDGCVACVWLELRFKLKKS